MPSVRTIVSPRSSRAARSTLAASIGSPVTGSTKVPSPDQSPTVPTSSPASLTAASLGGSHFGIHGSTLSPMANARPWIEPG
ncbi:hypothetical protein WME91_26375 [Sorangium sp. So ce269]